MSLPALFHLSYVSDFIRDVRGRKSRKKKWRKRVGRSVRDVRENGGRGVEESVRCWEEVVRIVRGIRSYA